jgi:hypothetical protein
MMIHTVMRIVPFAVVIMLAANSIYAAPKKAEPSPLTEAGEALLSEYGTMLRALQGEIAKAVPVVDPAIEKAFMDAHLDEGPKFSKVKEGSKQKPQQQRDSGVYKDFKRQKATLSKARPVLATLDGFLDSDAVDKSLVKCAVLVNATPRGLAVYAQQGAAHKARIDALLADHDLMKQMLVAGGAKAGRYGNAMEILEAIRVASKQPREGILYRLAIATALELAARELSDYRDIDPVKRYLAYEKWYLAGELDPHLEDMTTWECRHIINDYSTEENLAWLRTMLRNYRPDTIATEFPRDKYMALNGDIPQTTPQYDEDIARIQAIVCNGGRCGPKAALGRATTRAFGIPTWGARVKAHTGMTHWTPDGWTAALGVAFSGSFWDKDFDNMWSTVFRLDQMARENPGEYLKALRCEWVGDALGQKKIDGMVSGTGGFWHALALNKKRGIVTDAWPNYEGNKLPWAEDAFALTKEYKQRPEESSPLVATTVGETDRRIEVSNKGVITIPAAACVTPTASTAKILFMKSNLGGIQLHYRRKGTPESFVYEFTVPEAGDYLLSAKVVTVNRDQSLQLALNGREKPIDVPLPYTIGMWQDTEPVKIPLVKGKNTLSFTRSVPEEFAKHVWTRSGPEYGGISIRSFTLQNGRNATSAP